ncbi:MAG: hypothetical protein PHD97_06150 [Bacteroidales bacterium]|nr:hypothetical protein [Bacteroidales bacterium]
MKKLFLLIAVLMLGTASVKSQNQNLSTLGDSAFEAGNFKLAKKFLQRDIKKDTIINSRYYTLAAIFSLFNMPDSSFFYLKKYMKKPVIPEMILSDPDFYNLRKDKKWLPIRNILAQQYLSNNPNLEKEPTIELIDMNASNMAFNKVIENSKKTFGKSSKQVDSLNRLKSEINFTLQKRFMEILDKTGWPKISEAGNLASQSAFQIFENSDLITQKNYISLLKNAVDNKEAPALHYAIIFDKIAVAENRKQSYGTQTKFNEKTKKDEVYPIEDEKNVDKRRKELGLGPLSEYLIEFGIRYKLPIK